MSKERVLNDDPNDYVLGNGSCWIKVGKLVVYIFQGPNEVEIEVYRAGREMDCPIGHLVVPESE